MSATPTRHATRQPSAAAIRRKQAECMHPARNVHPTFDPRWEVCDLCGIKRPAGSAAPWLVAYDLAQPEPPAPPIFQGLQQVEAETEPETEPEPEPQPEQPRCPIASGESVPKRARQRARIRDAYQVEYRPYTRKELADIRRHPWHCKRVREEHPAPASTSTSTTPAAINARLLRLGGEYERAQLARDFGRCTTIGSQIADAGAELDRLTDCAYHWPFTVLRGRNIIRRSRSLELLNP